MKGCERNFIEEEMKGCENRKHEPFDALFWIILSVTIFIVAIIIFIIMIPPLRAEEEYPDYAIVTAIFHAEGGNKTRFPYGIKSIPTYGNKELARKYCFNTIRNHRKRHAKHNCKLDFISCLGLRYCPPTIKSEYHLNKNWLRLIKYFLNKNV